MNNVRMAQHRTFDDLAVGRLIILDKLIIIQSSSEAKMPAQLSEAKTKHMHGLHKAQI